MTQFNGMGLSAPQGQNCTVQGFLSGECLRRFAQQLAAAGARWSLVSAVPPAQLTPS